MKRATSYYVYVLARPNGKPFYVGKGRGSRVFKHDSEAKSGHKCHKCNVIRKIWKQGGEVQRYVVFTTENESEAFEYERELIALYGRENLTNLSDGGEGGGAGSTHSPAARKKHSNRAKEQWSNPETRSKMCEALKVGQTTPEAQAKRQENLKKQWSDPEARARKSAQSKAMWADPEFREKMRAKMTVAATTPEARERMTRRNKERWQDPEYRERMSTMLAAQSKKASEIGNAKLKQLRKKSKNDQ